jgi:hypothetical protein
MQLVFQALLVTLLAERRLCCIERDNVRAELSEGINPVISEHVQ